MERTNKLIAEFMGIEEAYNPNGNDWVLKKTTPDVNGDTDILESCKGNELQYNTSWDWLMPVIHNCTKIIENYGYDSDDRNYIEDEIFNLDNTLSEFLNNDIESVYARVVEFIKYYNQNN